MGGRALYSYISGDEGNDVLKSADGFSVVNSQGNVEFAMNEDYIYGGAGNDSIVGGDGSAYNDDDDIFYTGMQFLNGGADEDEIYGGDSKLFQQITGGSGDDWIWTGNDIGDV